MTTTPDTSAEVASELDVEDAVLDIEHSMAADDRQTRREYQAGCKALRALTDELTRLRAQLAAAHARVVELEAQATNLGSACDKFRVHAAEQRNRALDLESKLNAQTVAGEGEPHWFACSDELPDSDVWVLAATEHGEYALVQLEFTDDSEGHGEPYWVTERGTDFSFGDYPYWMLPSPPKTGQRKARG